MRVSLTLAGFPLFIVDWAIVKLFPMSTHEKNLSTKQAQTKKDPRVSHPHEEQKRTQSLEQTPPQGPSRAHRLSFPKSARLLRRKEFLAMKRGQRLVGKYLCIDLHFTGGAPRLGITASGKYGDAVERNRFKRLIREAFRTNRAALPPIDLHVIPRSLAKEASLDQLSKELLELISQYDAQSRSEKGC